MQGTLVWSLVQKISQAVGQLSPCSATTDPKLQSPPSAATEACVPTACAPQQEKPSYCNQREPLHDNEDPVQPEICKYMKFF